MNSPISIQEEGNQELLRIPSDSFSHCGQLLPKINHRGSNSSRHDLKNCIGYGIK